MRASAGTLITDPTGRLLFVKTWVRRRWEYPAGMVDRGETPSTAAAREAMEETGLDINELKLIGVTHFRERFRGNRIHFTFAASIGADQVERVKPQAMEIADWRWVPYEEAVELASGELRERLQALRAADGVVIYREETV